MFVYLFIVLYLLSSIILYMNSLDDLLDRAGISHSERVVYRAGLGKPCKTAELVKELKLPRSTIAAAIDSLEAIGLCQADPLDGKTFIYTMLPIKYLNTHLSQSAHSLQTLMNEVSSFEQPQDTLTTKTATGQEAVQQLIELALQCRTRKWHIIATRENPIKFMSADYTAYFKRVRKERQIASYSLWDSTGKRTLGLQELLMRKPRYVPKSISSRIPGLLLAFDDCLLMIEGEANPHAVLVENAAITETFRIMFDMAWHSVRPLS